MQRKHKGQTLKRSDLLGIIDMGRAILFWQIKTDNLVGVIVGYAEFKSIHGHLIISARLKHLDQATA